MSPSGHSNYSGANRFFRRSAFGSSRSRGGDSSVTLKERARAGKLKSPASSVHGGKPPVQALSPEPLSAPRNNNNNNKAHHYSTTPPAALVTTPLKTNVSMVSGVSHVSSPENQSEEQPVRVAVRLRPLNPLEVLASKRSIPMRERSNSPSKQSEDQYDSFKAWTVENHDGKGVLVQKGVGRKTEGKNMFSFDGVFQEHMGTAHVYDNFARPIVKAVLEGRHGTIFTYGTSGSGKTHSMQGDGKMGSLHKDGIIQLAVRDLFNHIKRDSGRREYVMRISFFEIYNEQVRDLLAPSHHHNNNKSPTKGPRPPSATTPSRNSPSMKSVTSGSRFTFDSPTVNSAPQGKTMVIDSEKQQVSSVDDVLRLLYAGNQNRSVATTILNDTSSRSHAIFRLSIESRDRVRPHHHHHHHHHHHNQNTDSDHIVRVSALNFVDLAGSENTAKAATVGSRRRESGKINQSLLSLSQVIHALSLPPKKRPKFINYRNSKLTRILQPHLSGNAVLAVLCCATPARANLEETRGTLKFGASAKRIQMKPVVNEIIDDKALIRKLQKDLKEAQNAIQALSLETAATKEKEPAKNMLPQVDLNTSLQVTVATEMSAGHSGTSNATGGNGEREQRFETSSVDREEDNPDNGRLEPSPLPSPTMTPERVSSPNNLSAPNLYDMEHVNAMLFQDGRLRSCDQDSGAERSIGHDGSSTLSDLSSGRPPTIRVVQDSPPSEVTIIRSPLSEMGDDVDINLRLDDAEERAQFLEEKLESADRLVELMTRDLRNARLCIHELVFRNVRLENQLAGNAPAEALPSPLDVAETRTGSRTEDESPQPPMPSERVDI